MERKEVQLTRIDTKIPIYNLSPMSNSHDQQVSGLQTSQIAHPTNVLQDAPSLQPLQLQHRTTLMQMGLPSAILLKEPST
uniref:Uncharacterized protein n=1 Tax=Oryza brachyantha TaxID=4533 RepID=J3LQ01_ORYBR